MPKKAATVKSKAKKYAMPMKKGYKSSSSTMKYKKKGY